MTAVWIALLGQLLVFAATFVGLRWERKRDQYKPVVDQAQVESLIRKTGRWRDARLAQYDRYFDEQDLPWHRQMTRLMEQAKEAGFLPPDAVIPPTPVLPDPPPYD